MGGVVGSDCGVTDQVLSALHTIPCSQHYSTMYVDHSHRANEEKTFTRANSSKLVEFQCAGVATCRRLLLYCRVGVASRQWQKYVILSGHGHYLA